jgi:hypothetical protein
MTTKIDAPDIPNPAWPKGGYPTKGAKLGPAWRAIWSTMAQADDFLDGRELAGLVARKHDLAPATLVALLSRAAAAGILAKELRPVTSTRGARNRTFYRIALPYVAVDE